MSETTIVKEAKRLLVRFTEDEIKERKEEHYAVLRAIDEIKLKHKAELSPHKSKVKSLVESIGSPVASAAAGPAPAAPVPPQASRRTRPQGSARKVTGPKASAALGGAIPPVGLSDLLRHTGDATKHLGDRPFAWHVDPRAPKPDVLAFDLAAAGGWALLGAEHREFRPINAAEARIDHDWALAAVTALERARCFAVTSGRPLLVVVEDTHLGSAARTPLAFAAIKTYCGALSALAAERGLLLVRIPARRWQAKVLGSKLRDQGKTLSLAVARRYFGAAITTDNVADAALLAMFVRGGVR